MPARTKRKGRTAPRPDVVGAEFLSFASHQLRTPLTVIRWLLARIRDGLPATLPEERRLVEKAHEAAEKMAASIDTMLAVAQAERAAAIALVPKKIILDAFLRDTCAVCAGARTADRRIAVHCPPGLSIRTDPKLLHEILCSLLDNALKYSPPGSPIAVRAEEGREGVSLHIANRGPGIPKRERERVFEKYFRGERAVRATADGVGLGLYFVRLLTRALGGDASFTSRKDATVFTVVLPRILRRTRRVA